MKRWRTLTWLILGVACCIAVFYLWRSGSRRQKTPKATAPVASATAPTAHPATPAAPQPRIKSAYTKPDSTAPIVEVNPPATNSIAKRTNAFPYRLSNTSQTVGELSRNPHGILLENALIDSGNLTALSIPDSLRSHGDPGAYIVQANGPINYGFRSQVQSAGATIVSYIPNNAYLIQATPSTAAQLGRNFKITPWEPYFKVKSGLMRRALAGGGVAAANVAVFPNAVDETRAALDKMGISVTSVSPSPFGTELALQNVSSITALAGLPGVEEVEPSFARVPVNDLTRVIMNDSADVFVPTNYLGLTGSNVWVAVADSWVRTNGATAFNPDLTNIAWPAALSPNGIADLAGHATHVGGIIAASGMHSPTNVFGSPPGADFRGKAPMSTIWALPALDPAFTDSALQEAAAKTNALISNNSWGYGTSDYNLAAASYDQAVRDSIPGQTGSQPLIYVFAAGNSGTGGDEGQDGIADSLLSPAVAKNVISVGASELPRNITNDVTVCDVCTGDNCTTNKPWLGMTDSSNQVARFSSRGNVGIGVEGDFGRFKPDVIAPGTFVVSTRSMTWDTNAYYSPITHDVITFLDDTVDTNSLMNYAAFVPCDATELDIFASSLVPTNVPMPIYVRANDFPDFTTFDLLGTNVVRIPPDHALSPVDTTWFYSVGNSTNVPVQYDTTSDVTRTNETGNYFPVLQGLNEQLLSSNSPAGTGPFYRYESGTSMAAPAVAGTLALMEDYFTNRLKYTPSPALMKALLINGARSINPIYDFQVQNTINYQGWGLVDLPTSIPIGLTNASFGVPAPMLFVDQVPTNALATGDSRTLFVQVDPSAQTGPLRVTLVWTDPPGNPAASIKLVNNLDLVVTNLSDPTNPVVYFGNDIQAGDTFNHPVDTNALPNFDNVNNVENIFIPQQLGTNYSITVIGRNVNVNAVTSHTNGVVQDYALVVSSGDGGITNALTLTDGPVISSYTPTLTGITNEFPDSPDTSGGILINQRVGASSPLEATNTLALTNQTTWTTNGQITTGVTNQWHFYVVTNAVGTNASGPFPYAAFGTFLAPNLSIPPVGVNAPDEGMSTRPEADIDLYVARGPGAWGLTNLDPTVIAAADKSLNRDGTELFVYTNAQPNEVFYIGVKAEDQEAAEYDLLALFSQNPFSSMGPNGEEYLHGINVPTPIPDGAPTRPGIAMTLAVAMQPIAVRRVVVTNVIEHENFGDLLGALSHNHEEAILNNHTFGNGGTNQILIYDDSGQGDVPGAQQSDGPPTLNNFVGLQGLGLWLLTEVDDAASHTGRVDNVFIKLDPQEGTNGIVATIQPGDFFYDYIDVPPEATNLTIHVDFIPPSTGPVQLFVRYGERPTATAYDYTKMINSPGDSLSIDRTALPPLRPGRYYVGIFNPTAVDQTVRLSWTFGLDPNGVTPTPITSTNGIVPLLDDAVTNDTILITNNQNIVSVNVGVVLNHPRISDLDLTLVSPTGKRILLFENRGGLSATNMGHLNIFTNFFGATTSGGANASTNTLSGIPLSGTLIIHYDFFTVPDQLDVYDGPLDIFSSGYVNGPGTFTIPYNLVNGTTLDIVMNKGNNPNSTAWTYTPEVVAEDFTYLTFTDDTNLTEMPIKFAIPPYDALDNGTNFVLSDFELAPSHDYSATTNPIIPDQSGGWLLTTNDIFVRTNYYAGTNLLSMATNIVSVVTDPGTANAGSNYLALASGSISHLIPLTPAKKYSISYEFRGPGIAGWWRGEGDATDSGDPEFLGNNGSLIGRFNFPAGEVGQAFAMEDSGSAFEFAGTNTYVQVRQSPSLDVGANSGFTVEGWINPTNTTFQQPLVEWLAHVPTNSVVGGQTISNFNIVAGPFLNPANGHYYYMLGQTNWPTSELWAKGLGGHLAEVDDANEQNWIYDTFAHYGGTNYTMWIGLTNGTVNKNFIWSTGVSNIVYTNWDAGQPTNCGVSHYVAILGPTNALPGLWTTLDTNGVSCSGVTNKPFGIVEVNEIQTNGVRFWISVTNAATPGLGRLYANIVDNSNIWHEIFSPPGLIQSNLFQHVALTYNTNTGIANLYYSGTNVASTNLGSFVPKTGGDVLIGKDMSRLTNNFFWGRMDEMSIYSRFLSPAEIAAIYNISANTTNRNLGKFDPEITPGESLAEAQVSFGGVTNIIYGANRSWQAEGFTLKAPSNNVPLQITGLEPGVLLDSFAVSQEPPGNLYYLPEQPLQALVGSNALGNWTLEIRDARTGAVATNAQLVSWELQFILQTNTPTPIQLNPESPGTNSIPPGQIAYFTVFVPSWAHNATNRIISVTPGTTVDLLFNQNSPPGTGAPGDFTLLANSTGGIGIPVLSTNSPTTSVPPLLEGQTYYLGVRNNGTVPSTVGVEVDFDMTTLTNQIPYPGKLNTNDLERPFVFNVTSNAMEATFQLLKLSGNADLVLRKGLPLPNLLSADYGSFVGSNADDTIYVLTNSLPVPLSAGPWYLDVIKRNIANDQSASNVVFYSVLAKELDTPPHIVELSNRVPVIYTAGPGAALTNFFRFSATNFPLTGVTNLAAHFEIYNQTGNGDLTMQTNELPLAPPFFQTSRLPGNNAEIILIRTNSALTNLSEDWLLGVPNNETNPINFTIVAEIDTNGFSAFPTAEGPGASTRGGALGVSGLQVYHVTSLGDSGLGTLREGVNSLTNGGTIVFDVFGTIKLNSPLYITNSFLTIAGQTAPGDGVTVTGATTYVQGVHDLILRYLRFRPTGAAVADSLQFTNASNVIVDHISAAYGNNDVVSVLNSSNVTVQWSVVSDSLENTNIAAGGSEIRYGSGDVTLHHNLYADNYSGNPTIGENVSLDFVNNVVFNWGIFSGFSTNDLANNPGGLTNFLNYSANYLIAGSNSVFTNVAFWGGTTDTRIFQTNNMIDTNQNSILDGANTSWGMFSNKFTEFSHPFDIPPTVPDEAFIAYERVLDFVGNSMFKRDAFDRSLVQRVRLQPVTGNTSTLLSGMAAWWPAEGNANDVIGNNNATGGIGYTNGEVGRAFFFDGVTNYLSASASPSLNIGTGSGVTIEGWIQPDHELAPTIPTGIPIVEWSTPTVIGIHLWVEPSLRLFSNIRDTSLTDHIIEAAAGSITTNALQHVAVTYDKNTGSAYLYVNGVQVANQNFGNITPLTTGDVYLGKRIVGGAGGGVVYNGRLDEFSVYNRALSPCEILDIYNAASAGKQSILSAATNSASTNNLPYLDVDHDGIPDFWEITLGENATNFSANADRDLDGYTDLEEYMNWLGVPHALTITNTQVDVDLYQMSGNTGNLLFGVSNGTNGTVYLTNLDCSSLSPDVAVFTPTNNFGNVTNGGFASFNYMVTNTDTMAYFGPVTVSVFVSAVPITNAGASTNIVVFTNPPPDQTIFELTPITITNTAVDSDTNAALTYTVSMIIDTNDMIANGWPLTNVSTNPSPVIDANGVITWTPTEAQGPGVYTITTIVTDNGVPPAHATNSFDITVNETNRAPFWPPNVPNPTNYTVLALTTLTVTNTAADSDIPVNPLSYSLLNAPPGASIDTNGIFTWTPTLAEAPGIYTITNVVTDTNAFALSNNSLSATNYFTVTVTAPIAPFAFTQPAQAVTGASAKLNGMATPNGLPTVAWFEWGTNTLYGNQTPAVSVGNSLNVIYTASTISGLTANVPYHFRLVVSNAFGGVVNGFDQILDESKVVVWGADYVRQAEVPPGLSNVVAIAGAYDHSLALKNNGTVVAWGDNTFNQTNAPAANNFLAIAGGQYFSMALKNNGTVTSWGGNILNSTNVPAGLSNVVMIAGGTYASLALQSNGNVVAWGPNLLNVTNVPPGLSNIVEVAGGSYHSLAIRNNGTVAIWGDDSAGQTNVPPSATNVVAIAGGNYHSLALRKDGTVVSWGDNSAGQTNVPAGLSNVVAIAAGGFHSLALKSDGTVVGWGDNSAGQASPPAGLSNVVAISSGYFHSMALTPTLPGPVVLTTTNGMPQTNSVLGGTTVFYRVNVPANADAATNSLLFTVNGSLNVWYSTNTPPTVTNADDFLLITNTTAGTSVVAAATSPQLAPGTTYYLGVQNTNSFAVSFGIQVDFHFNQNPLTNGVPTTNSVTPGAVTFYQVNVPTNVDFSTNSLLSADGPLNIWFSTNVPPTITNADDVLIITNATVGSFTSDSGSNGPPSFVPGTTYYLGVQNTNASTVTYALQVDFHFLPATNTIIPLTNGVPTTNSTTPGDITFYQVNVPTNVDFSTNSLLSANGPLNIWFSTNVPPTIANADDVLLMTNATVGSFTSASGSSGPPSFVPGTTYYLGVQNTNASTVTYALRVDFHFFGPATNTVPISGVIHTNINGTNGFLLVWFAPTNDLFKVQWSPTLSPATWGTFTNIVGVNTNVSPTQGEFQFFDDGSQTGGFSSLRFYRLILLNGTVTPPAIIPLTNSVPTTNSTTAGAVTFYQVNVPTNVDFSTNSLLSANGPLNIWFSTNVPPTIANADDVLLMTNATIGSFTSASGSSGPPSFVPGTTYYLGVQNTNASTVTYALRVDFHFFGPATNTVPISGVIHTNINGTNGFLLVWFAPTNDLFKVQWSPTLSPATWGTFTNIVGVNTNVSPTQGEFQFFDDGSQTGGFSALRFYRLILLNGTVTPPAIIPLTNSVPTTNSTTAGAVTFYQVNVPTNVDFSTNSLLSANGPLNIWFSTNVPPTIANADDVLLMTNATVGSFTSASGSGGPPSFVPGTTYYLGVQNTNASSVTYALRVDFHFFGPATNTVPISGVTRTNINGTNGFLLVWFAPTNDLFKVQWSPTLSPATWGTFSNIVGVNTNVSPTQGEFQFFDDGSQTGGFSSLRFYRLILLNGTVTPPAIIPLTNSVPTSNSTASGAVTFYQVNMPTNVDFSTNSLLSANGPLNIWFSTNVPPTVANADDVLLMTNATVGSFTSASGSSGPPSFVPGTTYYLGVQNTNASAVTYALRVDFHFIAPATNTIPISGVTRTNINGTNGFLLVWFAPTNDLFKVQWSPTLSPATWGTFSNIVGVNTNVSPTQGEFQFFDDGSQTGGFSSLRFYRLILLNGTVTPPAIIPLTNAVPTSNSTASGAVTFYQVNVPTNVDFSTNSLLSASGPLNIWFSTNVPPTIANADDVLLMTNATIGSFTSASGSSGPPSFVPGTTYYLGVQNTNASSVTYALRVDFHFIAPATNTIPISGVTRTNINGTNGFLLVWFAPTNDLFKVQWSPTLSPATWGTFSNIVGVNTNVSPTQGEFQFFDDGSQTGGFSSLRFYRLILLNGTVVSPSVIPLTNGVPLNFTTAVGATNFFSFDITKTNAAVLFELYNLNGNGDLTVQRSNLPVAPPYFASSTNPGTNYEQIVIRTNGGPTNINAISWFLGVPNQSSNPINYTIRAVLPTNGLLVSGLPINTAASQSGSSNVVLNWGPTVPGEKYEIRTNSSLITTNWGVLTDIIAVGTSTTVTNPMPTGTPSLFYRVVQVP
jgi:subtilisin-like proprotein convertase family protein